MKPTCMRVLYALNSFPEGVPAVYLADPIIGGLDYRKRVSELRDLGYTVNTYPIPGKRYHRYRLEGRP
jgi:hypothetical protein